SSPAILSNKGLQFNKFVGDASRYINLGGGNVLAFRIRGGSVFGRRVDSTESFIPPQERLYAGGPTTVRGFSQNELGALIYIAKSYEIVIPTLPATDTVFQIPANDRSFRRVVPVGGNALLVSNLELRLPIPFLSDI